MLVENNIRLKPKRLYAGDVSNIMLKMLQMSSRAAVRSTCRPKNAGLFMSASRPRPNVGRCEHRTLRSRWPRIIALRWMDPFSQTLFGGPARRVGDQHGSAATLGNHIVCGAGLHPWAEPKPAGAGCSTLRSGEANSQRRAMRPVRAACLATARDPTWVNAEPILALRTTDGYGTDRACALRSPGR